MLTYIFQFNRCRKKIDQLCHIPNTADMSVCRLMLMRM